MFKVADLVSLKYINIDIIMFCCETLLFCHDVLNVVMRVIKAL